ncbi:MAG: 2-nitropropane dioxygenase [Candidatus Levybacteria bacterium CG_4_10_14_0_2_um_filter_36_16]|nr:MAG: hypothetical protein AUK12_04215 [Candidatus Levybacteria bacterium CG2_30_37_29]PIZ96505.1 MAG: 2-nitropropane dioxygenase [Candidatus Levybacteria bacterium CG_4_10_14_0_2_um_filter_36_16]
MIEAPQQKFVPELIQGGMGVGVSSWELARSVAIAGEKLDKKVLGVVSGTGLPIMMINRLQKNDTNTIRALNAFDPLIAKEILDEYLPGDKQLPGQRYKLSPKPEVLATGNQAIKDKMSKIAVAAAFVEVWLAKEGHNGPIGINVLEKVQLMHLSTLLGAMMAGVDTVLVGAGIPHQIPQVLENFANNREASYKLDVIGSREKLELTLDPKKFVPEGTKLKKPSFYAIVSHHALAMRLNSTVDVDGFVVEGPTAGGHNAPARGKEVDDKGQPIYGDRDKPDLSKIMELGKPYWLAGSFAGKLNEAKRSGATGIQVGSVFALSNESGLTTCARDLLRARIKKDELDVVTSAIASPTGYPIQLVQLKATLTEDTVYKERTRVCSMGYLVEPRLDENGKHVFLCPAEPEKAYVRKGGKPEDAVNRVCLCNGLAVAAGHGQTGEPPIYTFGKDLGPVKKLIENSGNGNYSAEDVIGFIFSNSAR